MTPWTKKKQLMRAAKYVCTYDPLEREVLGNLAAAVANELMLRARSAPKDELAEMMDMPTGHTEAPQDPALARLLPNFEREGDEEFDGDNALLRSLHEADIITGKLTNLQVISNALGPDGNVAVSLDESEAHAFIAALNDLRLYLAASDLTSDAGSAVIKELPGADRDNLVEWLAFNQDSLLTALMGE
ncbi:DUF2017 domain-containing protein [Corynebacterium tapiri]|uniref:DUF2017 domain-containing protein n=1 Tax=Corynebacterium tapiri TaxID=1448266 RepID=A0A5C4U1W0_9CORY|nr:DUF2017 domain-containing protein [Corynebacterium tapiri]TNL95640.1 DUF2017 domain-containing protein [Corynebacterium tapiri]